jgi:putative tryptophan/tyrosine transport system substrate-binding protein
MRFNQLGRREFITLLGGAATWPLAARAQQPKVWRIGLLATVSPAPAMLSAFRDGLRERGYVEGQNLFIDIRWPNESFEKEPRVAVELVRNNIDCIVAWPTPAVISARAATSTIPIVMVAVTDPVALGFVASLARPGGNITGVSNVASDLVGKQVELLVEIVPGMRRIGVVHNPNSPAVTLQLHETEKAIHALGLQLEIVEASISEEFDKAFARLSTEGANGVVLLADPSLIEHGKRIADLAKAARLPTAFQRRESVEAGGLLSYGSSLNDMFRQAALYVDRILKGAKPNDLPVQQPTKFELVINLKTAKVLGLTVPPTMLTQADMVIE